jgi:hypothetical protein
MFTLVISGGTSRIAGLQAAHDFAVDLNGGAQLADFFLQGITLLDEGANAKAQAIFELDAILRRPGGKGAGGCDDVHDLALGLFEHK